MRTNIAAHTTDYIGDHVDFVSINSEEDGSVSIAVRQNGTHATVFLSQSAFEKFAAQINKVRS